jgi:hypothetical protein
MLARKPRKTKPNIEVREGHYLTMVFGYLRIVYAL